MNNQQVQVHRTLVNELIMTSLTYSRGSQRVRIFDGYLPIFWPWPMCLLAHGKFPWCTAFSLRKLHAHVFFIKERRLACFKEIETIVSTQKPSRTVVTRRHIFRANYFLSQSTALRVRGIIVNAWTNRVLMQFLHVGRYHRLSETRNAFTLIDYYVRALVCILCKKNQ